MKTADQMFREIGYVKTYDDIHFIKYFNSKISNAIILNKSEFFITAYRYNEKIIQMEYAEVLACAKLIKELLQDGKWSKEVK